MEKVIHLGAWFLLGCIASSFISWLGTIHPALLPVMWLFYGFVAVILVLMLLTDDAIKKFLKISDIDYYAMLIAIASAIFIGGIVTWLVGG